MGVPGTTVISRIGAVIGGVGTGEVLEGCVAGDGLVAVEVTGPDAFLLHVVRGLEHSVDGVEAHGLVMDGGLAGACNEVLLGATADVDLYGRLT